MTTTVGPIFFWSTAGHLSIVLRQVQHDIGCIRTTAMGHSKTRPLPQGLSYRGSEWAPAPQTTTTMGGQICTLPLSKPTSSTVTTVTVRSLMSRPKQALAAVDYGVQAARLPTLITMATSTFT